MPKAIKIKQLIEALKSNVSTMESKLGYSKSALKKAIDSNSDIKSERIEKLFTIFPNLNREWLFEDRGEMFITPNTNNNPENQEQKAGNYQPKESSQNGNIEKENPLSSIPPINQGDQNMITLLTMARTQENYSIAEKNKSAAAIIHAEAEKDAAQANLILVRLLQDRFGEEGLGKTGGMSK